MKKIKKWLGEMFEPESFNDLDVGEVVLALNDSAIRTLWIQRILADLKTINQEVDKRLLSDSQYGITDLCARRKAYQDILEAVLSCKRQVTQASGHNPKAEVPTFVDLDRVTA